MKTALTFILAFIGLHLESTLWTVIMAASVLFLVYLEIKEDEAR